MRIELISLDNGSCENDNFMIYADYNPKNKTFNKRFGKISLENFLECFDNFEKVWNQLENGKYEFEVPKKILKEKCHKLF